MPKVSKDTAAKTDDFGVVVDRYSDLEGYRINFVSIKQTHDLAPLLKGLPTGNCPCPHWGYVLKGRVTVRYADREEVIEAGEAFYMPPGHAPAAEAGTEIIQFSPAQELSAVTDAMRKLAQAAKGG